MSKSGLIEYMSKEKIYLTNITLHTKEFGKTVNFAKTAEKGRLYSPILINNNKGSSDSSDFSFSSELPKDLLDAISKGEVELMIPKDGLDVYAGKDLIEFMKSKNGKRYLRGVAKGKLKD